jgi:hypothetical protein
LSRFLSLSQRLCSPGNNDPKNRKVACLKQKRIPAISYKTKTSPAYQHRTKIETGKELIQYKILSGFA